MHRDTVFWLWSEDLWSFCFPCLQHAKLTEWRQGLHSGNQKQHLDRWCSLKYGGQQLNPSRFGGGLVVIAFEISQQTSLWHFAPARSCILLGPHLISTFRTLATCNELREIEIHCLNVVVCFQPKCTGSRMRPGMYNAGALPGCGPSDFIGDMQYWVCGPCKLFTIDLSRTGGDQRQNSYDTKGNTVIHQNIQCLGICNGGWFESILSVQKKFLQHVDSACLRTPKPYFGLGSNAALPAAPKAAWKDFILDLSALSLSPCCWLEGEKNFDNW